MGFLTEASKGKVTRDPGEFARFQDEMARSYQGGSPQSLDVEERMRAYQVLLGLSSREREGYLLFQKWLTDQAASYLRAVLENLQAQMTDGEMASCVRMNAGAWQALYLAAENLKPAHLMAQLEKLRQAGGLTRDEPGVLT